MKKLYLFVVLFSLSVATRAQQLLVLKQNFLPKHTYSINNKNAMSLQVTMHSDSIAKATGGSGDESMEIKYQLEGNTDLKTAEALADKKIPVAISRTIVAKRASMNNQEAPQQPDLLAGNTINGIISADGKIHADTTRTGAEINLLIKEMVNDLPIAISFPEKQFKIGDTFTKVESGYTVDLTNQGIKKEFPMTVTYKLTDIKENNLSFESTSEFDINSDAEYQGRVIKITGKGTSSGKLVFDAGKSYPLYKGGQIQVAFDVKSEKGQAKFKGTVWFETKADVTAN